jgi:CelD/BcsL family acetyltransferase involved in cellulose biosynthesis
MRIELYRDPAVFTRLAVEWNALLEQSLTRVPFLRAEYLQAWWAHKGGGEWAQGELIIAIATDADGGLVGIAPLFATPNRQGRPALLLLGSVEISDYLDLIVRRADVDAFCAVLVERLLGDDMPAWEVLDLYNLPAASPTRAALGRLAQSKDWVATETRLEPVPAIPLPDDWEQYLNTRVEKKERQEIRRKLRRAEGGEDTVAWYVVDREAEAELEAFLQMMTHDPDKARFLTPIMRDQFRAAMRAAAQHGWLHLAFLTVNGEKAAAYLSFDYGNRLWVYNSAIEPRFNPFSPGWVLLAYLLQWCIRHKRAAFDFMRGGEDYKFRFGAVADYVYRLQLSRALPAEALGGEPACLMNEFERDFFPA